MAFEITLKRYIREARAEETRRIKIDGTILNIGTGAGNEVQLEGLGVAINHATIEKTSDDQYQLTDLNTPDGTYVNNNLISKKLSLNEGDEIKIGKYSIVIRFPASAEDPAKISVTEIYAEEEETVEEIEKPKEEKVELVSRFKLSKSALNKTSISIFGLVLLAAFTVYWMVDRDTKAFSPGKLSDAHTQFNKACVKCHTTAWEIVPNNACLKCHKVNPHNERELFTPACVKCHFEHKGNPVLANLEDKRCTQCHSELFIKGYIPSSTYDRQITSFDSDHPEFAVLVKLLNEKGETARVRLSDVKNLSDNTPIKLNHQIHLKPKLRGPEGPENLTCESCHIVDNNGAYMLPIVYEKHCERCHTLEFDPRFGDEVVPHKNPEIVREFLKSSYTQYAIKNGRRLGLAGNTDSIQNWVSVRVKETEDLLYRRKKCSECHFIEEPTLPNETLPKVVVPHIPQRWFPHSFFEHRLHAKNLNLSCDSCHMGVKTSDRTADVLLPSIDKCMECHSSKGGAKTECVYCHQYHERDQRVVLGSSAE